MFMMGVKQKKSKVCTSVIICSYDNLLMWFMCENECTPFIYPSFYTLRDTGIGWYDIKKSGILRDKTMDNKFCLCTSLIMIKKIIKYAD